MYGEEVFEPLQMAKKDYGQDENRASSRASSRQQFQKIRTSRQDSLRDPLRERQVKITYTYNYSIERISNKNLTRNISIII